MVRRRFVRPTYEYPSETYLQVTDDFPPQDDDLVDIKIKSDGQISCFSFTQQIKE